MTARSALPNVMLLTLMFTDYCVTQTHAVGQKMKPKDYDHWNVPVGTNMTDGQPWAWDKPLPRDKICGMPLPRGGTCKKKFGTLVRRSRCLYCGIQGCRATRYNKEGCIGRGGIKVCNACALLIMNKKRSEDCDCKECEPKGKIALNYDWYLFEKDQERLKNIPLPNYRDAKQRIKSSLKKSQNRAAYELEHYLVLLRERDEERAAEEKVKQKKEKIRQKRKAFLRERNIKVVSTDWRSCNSSVSTRIFCPRKGSESPSLPISTGSRHSAGTK